MEAVVLERDTERHGIKVEGSLLPTMPFTLTAWWRQTIEPVLPFARHHSCVSDRAACTKNKQSSQEGPSPATVTDTVSEIGRVELSWIISTCLASLTRSVSTREVEKRRRCTMGEHVDLTTVSLDKVTSQSIHVVKI